MRRFIRLFAVVLLAGTIAQPFAFGAKKPRFVVAVDALGALGASSGSTYVIFPGAEGVLPGDLQFREFASYVDRALRRSGFMPASDPQSVDLAIFMNYGIGEPQTTSYSYSYPVFGVTGGGTSTFSGYTYGSGGTSYTTGTVTSQPTYGVVGSGARTVAYTTYFRYLVLSAIDVKHYLSTQEPRELWRVTITSTGSSGDLRQVFPILVAAGSGYLDKDTGRQVTVTLHENDLAVELVRSETAWLFRLSRTGVPVKKPTLVRLEFTSAGKGNALFDVGPYPECRAEFITYLEPTGGTSTSSQVVAARLSLWADQSPSEILGAQVQNRALGSAKGHCGSKIDVECVYSTDIRNGRGQGVCRDSKGREYRLVL